MRNATLLLVWLLSAVPAWAAEPKFAFETRKSADSVKVEQKDGRSLFVITSESGIGAADIVKTNKEAWPKKMTLRFQYNQNQGFKTLEGLVINPSPKTKERIKRSGAIEVDLPDNFLTPKDPDGKAAKSFRVVWTDAYRSINGQGWIVMLVSVGAVVALVSFCLYRVLTLPPVEEEHIKGPLEIDTGDTEDGD